MASLEEMVMSAVVQEAVSGAVSSALGSREEKASQGHLVEKLEMAHSQLALALERSGKIPITEAALLHQKMMFKHALKECHDMLYSYNHKPREDEGAPSLLEKIRSVLPFFSTRKDSLLSSSEVKRFEWFAEQARNFVRDLETGCTLAHHRLYLNPLITHLLQGSALWYHMVQGSQTRDFLIEVSRSEEHGYLASLSFKYHDRRRPLKSVYFTLTLRLSESTDILGITARCLQSLGPRFASLAKLSTGEVARISTDLQVAHRAPERPPEMSIALLGAICRQDPLCCTAYSGRHPCANRADVSSELTDRFPEPVITMRFDCLVSASRYKLQSSANGARCPPLTFTATFTPHRSNLFPSDRSLQEAEEAIQKEAIEFFIRHPEKMEYKMFWFSAHGSAHFIVSKPVTEIGGPKTRSASKRKRSLH